MAIKDDTIIQTTSPEHCSDYKPMTTCQALSFTTDFEDGIKVIEIHTHIRLNHTRMRKHNES